MYDFIVIGAGVAGMSVAAELARDHKVLILEMESQPGFHATGRSAALFSELYGNAEIRALSRASRRHFEAGGSGQDAPFVQARGVLFIANAQQSQTLEQYAHQDDARSYTQIIAVDQARALCPVLRQDYLAAALYEPDAQDIDVHAVMQDYSRRFRAGGGVLQLSHRVESIERSASGWQVRCGDEVFSGAVIVNAGGAWCDRIADMASITPVGLRPLRRTAVLVDAPPAQSICDWPVVIDIDEQFYFKADAGRLLLSPADETVSEPVDAQPEELDIAIAIDRVQTAADIPVRHVRHSWAGLRSFASDRTPVVGYACDSDRFFWLAGQGGYGVQTAPALSRLAAALASGMSAPADILAEGIDLKALSPSRFATHR